MLVRKEKEGIVVVVTAVVVVLSRLDVRCLDAVCAVAHPVRKR
jgi:hypothetical protein